MDDCGVGDGGLKCGATLRSRAAARFSNSRAKSTTPPKKQKQAAATNSKARVTARVAKSKCGAPVGRLAFPGTANSSRVAIGCAARGHTGLQLAHLTLD